MRRSARPACEGTVNDSSGAAIPGAAVTLRNKGTAATRSAVTDASRPILVSESRPGGVHAERRV